MSFLRGFRSTKRDQKRAPEQIADELEATERRRSLTEGNNAEAAGHHLPKPRPRMDVEELRTMLAKRGELLTWFDKETGAYSHTYVGLDSEGNLLPPSRRVGKLPAPYDVDIREWSRLDREDRYGKNRPGFDPDEDLIG